MQQINHHLIANSYWRKAFGQISVLDQQLGRCITDYCQNHRPDPDLVEWIIDRVQGIEQPGLAVPTVLQTIIESLQQNHFYYREKALPQIGQTFGLLTDKEPNAFMLALCERLFDLYATSLIEHINEEEELFERVLSDQNKSLAESIIHEDHHDETKALQEIIGLLSDHANPKAFDPSNILIVQLRNLANDLKIHNFIEEQLLFPLINQSMEQS